MKHYAARLAVMVACTLFALHPVRGQDANRYLLSYPGISGSTIFDPPGPGNTLEGQIELLSVSFGTERNVTILNSAREVSVPGFTHVECLMKVDSAALVALWRESINSAGSLEESAVIRVFTDTDPGPTEVVGKSFELQMDGPIISKFEQRGTDGDEAIVKIAIAFATITMTTFNADGTEKDSYTWDAVANEEGL